MTVERRTMTYQGLRDAGILRVQGHQMQNAVAECYVTGGEKGLWIDGRFWRRVTCWDTRDDAYLEPGG